MIAFFQSPVTRTVLAALNQGFIVTLELFFVTLIGALPLGLVIAFGSMNRWAPLARPVRWAMRRRGTEPGRLGRTLIHFRPLQLVTRLLVWIVRGTPLILQLIIIFYGPGMWFKANPWNAFSDGRMFACTLAFVINYACYFSVIYRGGIEGVPAGQREAGQVLGLTRSQIFFQVTLLQMVKRIVPPMSNEVITLVKDTSLARVIAITEITKAGEAFMKSAGITWPLFYTAVFYLAFVGILTILFHFIERKLSYFR